ncbi:MAG: methylmalonyl-CoA epimerase [Dethiobacteria bacterium]
MKLKKIDHLGIVYKDLEAALETYRSVLGLEVKGIEVVEDQKVKVAFLPIGETNLELLEPTDESSPIAKYIENKGEGIHHIAFRVDNVDEALKELKEKGVRLIDEKPRVGGEGARIAFIHPKETGRVLVELCEREED